MHICHQGNAFLTTSTPQFRGKRGQKHKSQKHATEHSQAALNDSACALLPPGSPLSLSAQQGKCGRSSQGQQGQNADTLRVNKQTNLQQGPQNSVRTPSVRASTSAIHQRQPQHSAAGNPCSKPHGQSMEVDFVDWRSAFFKPVICTCALYRVRYLPAPLGVLISCLIRQSNLGGGCFFRALPFREKLPLGATCSDLVSSGKRKQCKLL